MLDGCVCVCVWVTDVYICVCVHACVRCTHLCNCEVTHCNTGEHIQRLNRCLTTYLVPWEYVMIGTLALSLACRVLKISPNLSLSVLVTFGRAESIVSASLTPMFCWMASDSEMTRHLKRGSLSTLGISPSAILSNKKLDMHMYIHKERRTKIQ